MLRPRGPAGFTLIEMVTVLLILASATALALPAFLRLAKEDDLTAAARTVQRLMRVARDSAIHGGVAVTVVIDSVTGYVWLDRAPPLGDDLMSDLPLANRSADLPSAFAARDSSVESFGTILPLPASVQLTVPSARARFTFAPDGQAFAEHVELRSTLGVRTIHIEPWTGDVVVR